MLRVDERRNQSLLCKRWPNYLNQIHISHAAMSRGLGFYFIDLSYLIGLLFDCRLTD